MGACARRAALASGDRVTLLLLVELVVLDRNTGGAWFLFDVGGLCLAWQAWWILPFTPLVSVDVEAAPSTDDPDNGLRILTSNVLGTNRQSEKLLDLVREYSPDVLLTLESNAWWQQQLDQLESGYP